MNIKRLVARPVEIEALQWTGQNPIAIQDFIGVPPATSLKRRSYVLIQDILVGDSNEGFILRKYGQDIKLGWWIVKETRTGLLYILTDDGLHKRFKEVMCHI